MYSLMILRWKLLYALMCRAELVLASKDNYSTTKMSSRYSLLPLVPSSVLVVQQLVERTNFFDGSIGCHKVVAGE